MTNESLEQRVERLEDVNEIYNMMCKYSLLDTAGKHQEIVDMFAVKAPGVRAEIANWGVYEGAEGIRRLFLGVNNFIEKDRVGVMNIHALTTPVIEVAGDGQTAKGVWISIGVETLPDPEKGKPQGFWAWCKYGVDFIKEDGKWKFWRFHVYGLFRTPYEKSWVDADGPSEFVVPEELKADRPTTHPLWVYRPDAVPELVPVPPEPYKTWDEKASYIN